MSNIERLIFKLLERQWSHEAIHAMLDGTLGRTAVADFIRVMSSATTHKTK